MKITIEPTGSKVPINGVLTRHWVGTLEDGNKVDVFVAIVRAHRSIELSPILDELPAPEDLLFFPSVATSGQADR